MDPDPDPDPDKVILTGAQAVGAISHPDLVPPPRPRHFTNGATATLRDAMARFASTEDHGPRREAILTAIEAIDLDEITRAAAAAMSERFGNTKVDVVAASWVVPTYALAAVLGLTDIREQIRVDIDAVANVIGRNQPSTPQADAATERLLAAFADDADPVALVSLLYQNHDASSGLVRSAVLAAYGDAPPSAPATTGRVATQDTTVGDVALSQGDRVTITLAGMRFGAGPHRCPGEEVANAVVAGVLQALASHGCTFDPAGLDVGDDDLPTRFVLEVST